MRARWARAPLLVLIALAAGCAAGTPEPLPPGDTAPAIAAAADAGSSSPAEQSAMPGVRLSFQYLTAGAPGQDAVLRDWEAGQRAFIAETVSRQPNPQALTRYMDRAALAAAATALQGLRDDRQTTIGARRYYRIALLELAPPTARLSWCIDDSELFGRDTVTGKTIIGHGPDDHTQVIGVLRRNTASVWILLEADAESGVQC